VGARLRAGSSAQPSRAPRSLHPRTNDRRPRHLDPRPRLRRRPPARAPHVLIRPPHEPLDRAAHGGTLAPPDRRPRAGARRTR
jgi:hypothetical protein